MKRSKFYYLTHLSVGIPALLAKISDRYAIEQMWKKRMSYPLNLDNPQTFSEKLQWLKLYNRKPYYTKLVDKYLVKDIVGNMIGQEYIIPTLGVYKHFDDINFESLPNQFVLKCNHDSGSIVVCLDKQNFNIPEAKSFLEKCLAKNYYIASREWPYKNVERRIIAEPYMKDDNNPLLTDYKFYCFDGEPKFLYVSYGLADHGTAFISYMTLDWKPAPFHRPDFQEYTECPPRPQSYDKMIEIAKTLSTDMPFVRVDLYEINMKPYFSEMTFFPGDGLTPFEPNEWDAKIGEYIHLPN